MRRIDKYESYSSEQLAEAFCLSQDEAAYRQLYHRHHEKLTSYLRWISKDVELARDISQNIFLKILQRPDLLKEVKNINAWLITVAKNSWRNEVRSRKVHKEFQINSQLESEVQESSLEVDNSLKIKNVNAALSNISDKRREVFVLKYSNNLTIKEIAEVCGCSEGTVKSRLFYALKELKEKLNR